MNSSYHPDPDGGLTDVRTEEQDESNILLSFVAEGIISNFRILFV